MFKYYIKNSQNKNDLWSYMTFFFLSRAKETETRIIPVIILQMRNTVWWLQLKTTTTQSVNRRAESNGHWWRRNTPTHTRTRTNHTGAVALQGDTAATHTTEPNVSFWTLYCQRLSPFLKYSTLYYFLHWFSPLGKVWSTFALIMFVKCLSEKFKVQDLAFQNISVREIMAKNDLL